MIHIIYIYFILNALITGFSTENFKTNYNLFVFIFLFLLSLLIGAPVAIISIIYEFSKVFICDSWVANIYYVAKVNLGLVQLSSEAIDMITNISNKKKASTRKTFKDKIYIWGAKSIINYYNKNQK
jgi:hypothetical protein